MKQFVKVFAFELKGLVQGKWFKVSSFIVLLIVVVAMALPNFININDMMNTSDVSKTSDTIAIHDPNDVFVTNDILKTGFPKAKFKSYEDISSMKKDIISGKSVYGFSIKNDNTFTYYVNDSSMTDTNSIVFEKIMNDQHQKNAMTQYGLKDQEIQQVFKKVSSKSEILGIDGMQNYVYTYILIFLLYFVVIFYGQMTAAGVASEKGNRAMEILVTSTSSNALIFGKVLAGAIAGIIQCSLLIGVSMIAYQINAAAWNNALDFIFNIPAEVLIAFAYFGIMGYLFYSFIFGALGAMVSKVEDISSAVSPIMIIYIVSFFITIMGVLNEPDSILSIVSSYVPFTSCMAMFAKIALGSVLWWEVLLSGLILLLTTILTGILGAKIYRHGTLSYGNSFKFKSLIKIIRQKKN